MEPTPTVYLVDDDAAYLRSLSRMLRASGYTVVMHNAPAEFLAELRPESCGCVVTDLQMPGIDGLALQEQLHQRGNPLPIIFLSGHGDIPTTVKAMRGGADDFLTKHAPKEDILAAVDRALAHDAKDRAERARLAALRQPFELLSTREREVLDHVVQGQLNKQIASDLGVHERTVKLHRANLCHKLGVHSVAELTRLAQDAGVLR
ncbi:MAG: response regulator transcription factor [Opitutaceae bacterium]|nr:response regulator transcription factor [Opitutaceae bacterium]